MCKARVVAEEVALRCTQAPRFSPVRALVRAAPPAGAPRHDFFADVMHGVLRSGPPASSKCAQAALRMRWLPALGASSAACLPLLRVPTAPCGQGRWGAAMLRQEGAASTSAAVAHSGRCFDPAASALSGWGGRRYDMVWDLLHAVRAPGAAGAGRRWDPMYQLLERVSAAAEWGLPSEGPAAALLRADPSGWEPPRCAPRTGGVWAACDGTAVAGTGCARAVGGTEL